MFGNAGSFLDDRPMFIRPRHENVADLALAHQNVLMAAYPRVGQQLVDVEQAAWGAVHLIF
jgi:hypothetical protein